MKKQISFFLALIIVLTALLSVPLNVSAESLYIRKIVSVVYDDSGSMWGDKKMQANYAMQAFCGMLNSEDQLYITFMSSPHRAQKIDLSAGSIQRSIDEIRTHTSQGGTPYEAVETAYEELSRVQDSNPNTQYWLVVITDGAFNEYQDALEKAEAKGEDAFNAELARAGEDLTGKIEKFADSTMPNGSKPQITFMTIGPDVVAPKADAQKGIYNYEAPTPDDIVDTMSAMADRISGRTRLTKNDMKKVDANTVEISSDIPLLNIAVLVQNSAGKVKKVVYSNEVEIPISRNVYLKAVHPDNSTTTMIGGAALLGDSQNPIGKGTYRITFEDAVNLDNVDILYEPALEMRMTITHNGQTVTDYNQLDNSMEGDEISISCQVYEMGTDNVIDPSLLPPGTNYRIEVYEDGKQVAQSTGKDMTLSSHTLKNLLTELVASLEIAGFNPINYSIRFTPSVYVDPTVYTVQGALKNDVDGVKFKEIASNKDLSVVFTVLGDGNAVTDLDKVKELDPQITVSPDGNAGTIDFAKDGTVVFTPNAAASPNGGKSNFEVTVTCTLNNGESATQTYKVLMPEYQVVAVAPENNLKSIRLDQLSSNQKEHLVFQVCEDGVPITDVDVVKSLNPQITVSPQGNGGSTIFENDGTIIFTPNAGSVPASASGSYDVTVTCTLEEGQSASQSFTVLISDYQVVPVGSDGSITKTEFYQNKIGASFYITKDGVQLKKADVESGLYTYLNEEYANLKTEITVAADGTIKIVPYSEEKYELTFWRWWTNWWHYFSLPGEDVVATLNHSYGTGSVTIEVVEEDLVYQILNVYLPLILECAILAFLIWWVYAILAKPKFLPDAALYVGYLDFGGKPGNRFHEISSIEEITLAKYNKLKYRWKPTLNTTTIFIDKDIYIAAGYGGSILCKSAIWYKGDIRPKQRLLVELDNPTQVKSYVSDHDALKIQILSPYDGNSVQPVETIDGPKDENYYVHTDLANIAVIDGIETIESGTIFAYAIRRDN